MGLAIVALATATWLSPTSGSATCGQGVCFDYNPGDDGNGVDVGGVTTPDDPGEPVSAPDTDTDDGTGDGDGTPADPVPAPPGPGDLCWDNLSPLACPNPGIPEPTPEQPTYPDTIYNTDLITFTPHDPTATAPNEAMALANTPLPMTLTTTTHTVTGSLLGHPVSVTFIPAGYTLDHGDNTAPTYTADNPATITHTYTTRGIYPTTIATHYTATVTFPDNIPRPVHGIITTTTLGPTAHILTARTAPVRTTCNTAPAAPGC
ncbi:hypothetical protein [Microbacterium gorillae]|uniref:hypothetical protein n=1 Tax=Microbacterium gorillae TaxID=1231063 RepID=UPI003D9762C0